MGIKRTELPFEGQFVQTPNNWARDARLSRRARGLLVEIMSHRVGWHISIASLQKAGPEGRDAIRSALAELLELGYVKRAQDRGTGGRFNEIEYELSAPTVVGKSDTGGLADSGSTDDGSTDIGKSDTKNTKPLEDHSEEHQGEEAPLKMTCGKHPNGTTRSCGACGTARRLYDEAQRNKPTPGPPKGKPTNETCNHKYVAGWCVRGCEQAEPKAEVA